MNDDSLFDDRGEPNPGIVTVDTEKPRGTARTKDHHTSTQAGLRDLGRRGGQRERIAFAFFAAPAGLTDEQAAINARLAPQSSPWKRCTELREWGYLVYTGVDRETTTGSPAKVWTLTIEGRAALDRRCV